MTGDEKDVIAISKSKILIVDDSELNRSLLACILGEEHEVLEAEDGIQAVALLQKQNDEISLVLLDAVMPRLDGFGLLEVMQQKHWLEDIPVIMISADGGPEQVQRAYELGATDFIARPFDARIVQRRVTNTILLYAKQRKLIGLMADQMYERQRQSSLMIDILSHIIEFRNGESGLHILHVRTVTEQLLEQLARKTSRYRIGPAEIAMISTAAALHDVGKIAISEEILNKPGRLTDEEYAIVKTHARVGAEMLDRLPVYQDEPLIRTAYEICRWHHERYDGSGYPDGLKGDAIPISAQVVALADAYDALTGARTYKQPLSHEQAVEMICEGSCGAFNPLLLDCLHDCAPMLKVALKRTAHNPEDHREVWHMTQKLLLSGELANVSTSLQLLNHEREKYNFYATMAEEIQFEYTLSPPMITFSDWGARRLGLDEVIVNPQQDPGIARVVGLDTWEEIAERLRCTTPAAPVTSVEHKLLVDGHKRWYRITARAFWSADDPPSCTGAIGKAVDIHDMRVTMRELEARASHDLLTGLLNHTYARAAIQERLRRGANQGCALVICDLDYFKSANDNYGHIFGDRILQYTADKLRQCTRNGDIVARVGGDEFLLFLEYQEGIEPEIEHIFSTVCGVHEGFPISLSMGVARTAVVGVDYAALFHAADQALYTAKRAGRGRYCFYDPAMQQTLSSISSIESGGAPEQMPDCPPERKDTTEVDRT